MTDKEWKVHRHGPLTPLAENLWTVTGAVPHMSLERTMTVARLQDGGLVLHSVIAMDDARMADLEALGTPQYMVVPNGWHRLDAARYKARYPQLKVICPRDARAAVEKVVPVDTTYERANPIQHGDPTVRLIAFPAKQQVEGVMVVTSADGNTLAFGDTLFNLERMPGLCGLIYGKWMGAAGGPKISPIGVMMMRWVGDCSLVAAELRRIAVDEKPVRLVPGHGALVTEDPAAVLKRMAAQIQ